jgi:hypothetical protein
MKHSVFAHLAWALALFAGCSCEEEFTQGSSYPADNLVRITTNIDKLQTRAGHTTSTLRNFGISIVNPVSSNYTYNNVKVEKSSDGSWKPEKPMYWNNREDTADIAACAPYSSTVSNLCYMSNYKVSVSDDQSNMDDYYNSDFMVFKKLMFIPKTGLNSDGALAIEFEHAMCQLNITVEFSKNKNEKSFYTSNPLSELKVCGTKLNGTCDFTGDKVKVTATDNIHNIIAQESETFEPETKEQKAKAHYSCIVIPQRVARNLFSISLYTRSTANNYVSTESVNFEGGRNYQLNLSY